MKVSNEPQRKFADMVEEIMKRWHQEVHLTLREWKKYLRFHDRYNFVDCKYNKQKGRFRKKDAGDCGNPRCYICHSDKFPKRDKTSQEIKFKMKMKEQIEELDKK